MSTTEARKDLGYVLVERFASANQQQPIWFKQMTAIGPMSTANAHERHVFASEDEARKCPALWHAMSFYEIQPVLICDLTGDVI